MWNFDGIGREPYRPAPPITPRTFSENFKTSFFLNLDILKCVLFLILNFLKFLIVSLIPRRRKSIEGKLALVTGGANGLGREIAFRLASQKCNVLIVDLDYDAAKKTANEICRKFNGITCEAFKVDVSNYMEMELLKRNITAHIGTVNILVNNAGILPLISFREGQWRDVEKILKVNLHANIWATRIFLDDMIQKKDGHIVAISSVAGMSSGPKMAAYSSSKAGLNMFMGCLADELQFEGHSAYIKTTTVCPYFINTRKELIDSLTLRVPPLETTLVADQILNAMLKNKEFVIISPFFSYTVKLLLSLPRKTRYMIGDNLFNFTVLTSKVHPPMSSTEKLE